MNVEQLWSKFKISIVQVVNKHIPYKLSKKRSGLPWISQNIRKLIKKRDKLYAVAWLHWGPLGHWPHAPSALWLHHQYLDMSRVQCTQPYLNVIYIKAIPMHNI